MTCNITDISRKSWHKLMVLIIVVLALVCIMLNAKPAYAAEIVASGECGASGSNVTWTLDDEGVLTISGEGEMADFSDNTTIYFKPYINDIKTIIIENGVTNIGDWTFSSCINLTNIKIPNSVASIGIAAFKGCSSLTGINVPNSVLSIEDSAFSRCDNLMKLLIPESVRSIGKNIFYRTEQVDVYVVKNSYADTWLQDNGYSEKIKYVYKSGEHYYFETVTEPTCEETGSKHLLCVVCGETTDERIPALGHNIIKVEAKEPTLREDGNIEYWLCERCGKCFSDAEGTKEIFAESVVIPKTGVEIIESGTCGANGDNLTWTLDENGVLIISGTGEMYSSPNDLHTLPWYRKDIKHVVIEDGVTSIGGAAFIHSATLVDISIPASVTKIGNMAFAGCSSMTSIVIPEGVTGIGINEFQDCSSLNSVVIPASVTSIGDGAFAGCSSLASLSIPETVKSIGANAFAGCNSLTSIVIPEGVTAIASSTFSNCTNLESIEIPEGVTEIGWSAFKNCSNLTEISLPSTLLTLDGNYVGIYEGGAFYGCINLKNIIIPESVTSIGDRIFYGCSSLESIIIPSSVGSIGAEAFNECTALESVIIEDGLVSIGFDVFENCQNLTKILIPKSVRSIGERPFTNCDRLTDTFVIKDSYADTWLNNNEYSETIKYVYKSGEHYYYETVTEPTCEENGSKHIICVVCNEALDEQIPALGHDLAKVEAKEPTLREDGNIEYWLCERCGKCFSDAEGDNEISAESVVIPKTGGEIIDSGTCGADGDNLTWTLDENGVLVISGTGEMYSPFNEMPRLPWYGKDIKHVIIEEGVTTIGNDAFQRCSSLTSIEIPESVTAIRNGAFYGCSSLTNIEIPESVTSIGDSTFFRCNSLTSITIPDGVTSIGGHTFYGCNSLTSIIIPDSVMSIGQGAFSECSNLTSIDIPEGVTSIEYASFEGCINLTSVTIPKSVTNIGERAFYGCSSLESINIPEGVTNIGEDAFNNCVSLKSLTIPESVSSIGEGVLNNCKSLISVYVVNDSYADTWLKDNGYSEKIKYVYKSGEHYYYETTVTEPTCEENGLKHILCVDSNEATDEQIPATGHTPGDIVRENEVFATCMEAGNYDEVVYCQTCNKELSRNKKAVPALGHDIKHHEAKDPTCEDVGWEAYDACSRCDYTTYVEIPAIGHTTVTDPAVDPTCENTGFTEGSHCSVCGKVLVEQETIAALGHDYHEVEGTAVAATCTTTGKHADQKCSRCDSVIEGEAIAAFSHDWGEWVVVKEATTTEEGLERRTCLRDESHYEDRVIPKKIPEKTGWINEDGYWYFYEQDGTMAVSIWKKDSKGWCYLAEDGRMVTNGWAKDTKGWCWIGPAGYMIEKTQWVKYDGGWYHITNGYRDQSKWMKDSQGWCWLQEDGRMLTNGWAKDSKGWCWIAANGYMPTTTQWIKYDDGWYHITKGYRDESKWMKDSKGWCWLQEDGRMLTNGWAKDSKGWCWIGDSGYMVTDTKWIDVDGVRYYIKKGYMAVNCWAKDDNGWLYLGPDGLPVTGTWKKDTKGWCYVGDDGYMVTNDFVKDTKGYCWIGPDGYMIEEDMWIGEAGAEGSSYIIKGYRVDDQTIEIDGVEYTFDQDGKLVG